MAKTPVPKIEEPEQQPVPAETLEARRKIANALLGIQWCAPTIGFVELRGIGYEETLQISIGKKVKVEGAEDMHPALEWIVAKLDKELRDRIQRAEDQAELERRNESIEPEEL